jgi:hypothetical protein
MAAFAPRSTAALTLDRERHGQVQQLLAGRYTGARVEKVEQLNEDVLEVCFTVPRGYPSPMRDAKLAWICKSGTVQVIDGWPA